MITINQLTICITEAKRFIEKAGDTRDMLMAEKREFNQSRIAGNKLTGTVRRASMDLSRSLADLRKS